MFTNPSATTKSINPYILLWFIRVERATRGWWLVEVFVEKMGFFCLFVFLFFLSGFCFTAWGRYLFQKKWKPHKMYFGKSRLLQNCFCEH